MTWILIIYMVGSNSMAITSVEFNTKDACLAAKTEMDKAWSMSSKVGCFEKGLK